jgi:hypothetical protein
LSNDRAIPSHEAATTAIDTKPKKKEKNEKFPKIEEKQKKKIKNDTTIKIKTQYLKTLMKEDYLYNHERMINTTANWNKKSDAKSNIKFIPGYLKHKL